MRPKIEPFYVVLGSQIRKSREHRKMTQRELGHSLEPPSTRASIANIENGKQRVLAHTLSQLARSLDVDVRELIPALDKPNRSFTGKDVERELRKKLKLDLPELRKLTARLAAENARDTA
jgi:transcriptional regulator with XRE-family HTH domain